MKIGNIISANARNFPDREAVICGDKRVTYREFDDRSNRLANALRARGQAFGDRVVLFLPNSTELAELMAAVFKSGGVMVPISTRLTVHEVAYIIGDCAPVAVFFAPQYREAAHKSVEGMDNVLLISMGAAEAGEISFDELLKTGSPDAPPPLPLEPDTCLIGYTSGTTGRPKGAIATHMNLIAMHGWMNGLEWGLSADERILVTTPMAHRTGTGRIAQGMVLGATLVILENFDAVTAVDTVKAEQITMIGMVPTIARMLLAEVKKRPADMASVKKIIATGEAFPFETKKELLTLLPDVDLYYFYAQTEAGYIALLKPEYQLTKPNSVGQIVPGVEVRICDDNLNDVPAGEAGEVIMRCGARGVVMTFLGYHNRPEAEAEIFLEGGWIRTGDMAYIDKDGFMYFVDRVRDMIVSGGLNIYSKEVELALCEHDAVGDAAVIGVPDPEFGEAVLAFIELAPGKSLGAQELIDFTREYIASYKKPKHIRIVDELPRTGTGKITKGDLRKLAEAEFGGASGAAEVTTAAQ